MLSTVPGVEIPSTRSNTLIRERKTALYEGEGVTLEIPRSTPKHATRHRFQDPHLLNLLLGYGWIQAQQALVDTMKQSRRTQKQHQLGETHQGRRRPIITIASPQQQRPEAKEDLANFGHRI